MFSPKKRRVESNLVHFQGDSISLPSHAHSAVYIPYIPHQDDHAVDADVNSGCGGGLGGDCSPNRSDHQRGNRTHHAHLGCSQCKCAGCTVSIYRSTSILLFPQLPDLLRPAPPASIVARSIGPSDACHHFHGSLCVACRP
jgi:hypothetical protein